MDVETDDAPLLDSPIGTSSQSCFVSWATRCEGEVAAASKTAGMDCGDVSICRRFVGDPADSLRTWSVELLGV